MLSGLGSTNQVEPPITKLCPFSSTSDLLSWSADLWMNCIESGVSLARRPNIEGSMIPRREARLPIIIGADHKPSRSLVGTMRADMTQEGIETGPTG